MKLVFSFKEKFQSVVGEAYPVISYAALSETMYSQLEFEFVVCK